MSNYIHGSEPSEQARLTQLNDLINRRCQDLLALNKGDKVLDVGSGLGQFTLSVAERVGSEGSCVGIERDKNQLKTSIENLKKSGRTNIQFREGNAENLELGQGEW